MNYTLVGAYGADISSIGVNLFDVPLNGVTANNVVVINETPPVSGVGFDVGVDIGFLDAGVEYPVAGAGAAPFNSAHPHTTTSSRSLPAWRLSYLGLQAFFCCISEPRFEVLRSRLVD